MSKTAFDKIAAGMHEAIIATAMAKSDAEFDGRPWGSLGRADRERYIQRSIRALAAAEQARRDEFNRQYPGK